MASKETSARKPAAVDKTAAASEKAPPANRTAAPANRTVPPPDPRSQALRAEMIGLSLLAAALGFGAALVTYSPGDMELIQSGRSAEGVANLIGPVGARIADLLLQVLGLGAFVVAGLLLLLAVRTLMGKTAAPRLRTALGIAGLSLAGLILLHLSAQSAGVRPMGKDAAGLVPGAVAVLSKALFGTAGTVLVATLMLATSAAAISGRSLVGAALAWLTGRATPVVNHAASSGARAARTGASSLWERLSRRRPAWGGTDAGAEFEADLAQAAAGDRFADLDEDPAARSGSEIVFKVGDLDEPSRGTLGETAVARPQAPVATATPGTAPGPRPRTSVVQAAQATAAVAGPAASGMAPMAPPPTGPAPVDGTALRHTEPLHADPLRSALPAAMTNAVQAADEPRDYERPPETRPRAEMATLPAMRGLMMATAELPALPPEAITPRETTSQMDVGEVRQAHEALARMEGVSVTAMDETPKSYAGLHAVQIEDEALLPKPLRPSLTAATSPNHPRSPRIIETEALRNTPPRGASEPVQFDLGIGGRTWALPPTSLLQSPPDRVVDCNEAVLRDNAMLLAQKLAEFHIQGEVTEIRPGPVVTTYEYRPAPGIKISKIVNLRDDLTMSLSALRVRIVAPIPGRDVVGIEVPNRARQMVYFREVVESAVFREVGSCLTLILGKDIEGRPLCTDLQKAPHMLVAGATGTGKSVGINTFICSMLYRATPDEVKFIFIDPKVLELSVYEGIPHLLLPVLDEPRKAELALKWACVEMDRRYRLLSEAGVRNLAGYKAKLPELKAAALRKKADYMTPDAAGDIDLEEVPMPEDMPYIVVVIDEFADLIMAAGKEVEVPVARLAQKARAAGIHVILATQRPSVDVITGMIKANFPTRVSFQVASSMDSKVVLNSTGAETLLGKGDMLYIPPGEGHLKRAHGTWITDDEVLAIAKHWKDQGAPKYDLGILTDPDCEALAGPDDAEDDALYDDAVRIAIEANQASVSFLQRKLGIGYGRSARIIDTMASRGVVGPSRGPNKPREILAHNL